MTDPPNTPSSPTRRVSGRWRLVVIGLATILLGLTVAWRGPGVVGGVLDGLVDVRWPWALAAVGANVASLLLRGMS